jgi:cellulose biosynthesis protein BcsQ
VLPVDQLLEMLRQYAFLFTVLAGVITIIGVVFAIYKASHDRQVSGLNDRIRDLEQQLDAAKRAGDPVSLNDQISNLLEDNGQLQNQLGVTTTERDSLLGQCDELRAHVAAEASAHQADRDAFQQKTDGLTVELEGLKEDLASKNRIEDRRKKLVSQALKLEGKIWQRQRKVLRGAPPFRPLHERHAAIIAVVNLKGGVGKTTITANLAMGLSSRGYRVLMVDLDLQGSLSSLFVNESVLEKRLQDGLLLQHFLTKVATHQKANLLDCCEPVLDSGAAIIPTTDSLGYAESGLTMQWQLGYGKRDVRFLLRRGLHKPQVAKRFDIVLVDCPPILNACCLNALAASDYVLVPAVPSRSSAVRVPLLLRRLEQLKPFINPNIQVLGALLNRTRGAQPSLWERDLWSTTLTQCQNVWKLPIYSFQTFVQQTTEVRDQENEFAQPDPGSVLHAVFSKIVDELEARLPNDCRRVPSNLD